MRKFLPPSSANFRWLLALWLLLCGSGAWAAELAASAQLSRSVTDVGQPVQLHIKVSGARSVGQPPQVNVDGLRIDYLGPSQNTTMRIENGSFVSETSITYMFQVEPTRLGSFTIPAVRVSADGRTAQTQPVVLRAEKSGGSDSGTSGTPPDGAAPATLEIILPKKTAYVGEMLPVEIRMSVDSRIRWQPESMPEIPGEGFTKQKFPEPRQEQGTRDGNAVDMVKFRTAITPSKAGRLTLGPVDIPYSAQVPRARANRPHSLFDMFDEGVFGDPFFSATQRFKAHVDEVTIEVKPLPTAGRPADFSGAVGEFKMEVDGNPKSVKVGDPVTMKMAVSGRGNFDRMEAPTLVDAAGWRTYPPAGDFKAGNDLGTSGTKTFSMAVIPEEKKTEMPRFEFVYFDPAKEKYVTLKSESVPLTVEGGTPPLPPPVASRETGPGEPAPAPEPPKPQANDIHGLRYDAGGGRHSFRPLYLNREFLLAQLVPVLALGGVLVSRLRRTDVSAKRKADLKREKSVLLTRLHGGKLADAEFLETAAQAIQLQVALTTGRSPGSVDAAVACATRKLDPDTIEGVERIFGARAELLYAGAHEATNSLSVDERQRVLATVDAFEKSHARA